MIRRSNLYVTLSLLLGVLIFATCAGRYQQHMPVILKDGKYDSEFPSRSPSEFLERLARTVKRLSSIAFYEGYIFPKRTKLTRGEILDGSYKHKAIEVISFNNSAAGTATIVYAKQKKLAVLTCAHIVDYPDTVIVRYHEEGDTIQYVESLSLKKKQRNLLVDISEGSGFEILAFDKNKDIAVLGKEFMYPPVKELPLFDYPLGSAKELQWGTFVYIIGWPKGNKMVTRGIISSPNRDKQHSFLVDALFNRGFSGGIVMAIRDGIPNFELVGIISSVSASFENVLVPEPQTKTSKFDPALPYEGEVYIKDQFKIDYGITHGISIETIQHFLNDNRSTFEDEGYDFPSFFHRDLQ